MYRDNIAFIDNCDIFFKIATMKPEYHICLNLLHNSEIKFSEWWDTYNIHYTYFFLVFVQKTHENDTTK
jgi:hypothetical protein